MPAWIRLTVVAAWHCAVAATAADPITRRSESVGGTPAARLVHGETETLAIGPYLIDTSGAVHAIPPSEMEGRLTAHARGLSESERSILVYDMEGLLYDLDLQSRKAGRLFTRAVPGWHGKGAHTGQGVLVVANNGEHVASLAKRFEPFEDAVPNTRANPDEAGALAEWDEPLADADEAAQLLRDKAIPGVPTVEFDAASVILREGERVFRLPKPLDPRVAAAYEQPSTSSGNCRGRPAAAAPGTRRPSSRESRATRI